MKKVFIRQIPLSESENTSLEDWAKMTHKKLLELAHKLKLQYLYSYNLPDKADKMHVEFRKL